MKKLSFTIILLLVGGFITANAQQIETPKEQKIVTHVIGDNYDVVYKDLNGNTLKEGKYLKIGDRFKPHGIWKLYDRSSFKLITTSKYDKGEQLWVETIIDGKILYVGKEELKMKRHEVRIAKLDKKANKLK
ncbi:MAG: hypothetical protein JJ971_00710 [Balneolaceae bacterium]|nr:hypothetical protein [Balneolaceae bacterium]MBO6544890.1 hypothetical protein [Balneolaceae bacterium]MBO6646286.1 hypothetical protein [Balneolaceae bacterium]